MSANRDRVKAVFFDALDQPEAARAAFVRARSGGDRALEDAVLDLLSYHSDEPLLAEDPVPAPQEDPLGMVGLHSGGVLPEAFVAEGGFSLVYRGRTDAGDDVAIKIFKETDPERRVQLEAAFRREGALLATLDGAVPGLVRTHGMGSLSRPGAAPLLMLVQEWVDGTPLTCSGAPSPLSAVSAGCRRGGLPRSRGGAGGPRRGQTGPPAATEAPPPRARPAAGAGHAPPA